MNSRDKRRTEAEQTYAALRDEDTDQPFEGNPRPKRRSPGGNTSLPVAATLESPDGAGFWRQGMPEYILGILDETDTNGYILDGALLKLLSGGTELAKKRLDYATRALEKQGAVMVT